MLGKSFCMMKRMPPNAKLSRKAAALLRVLIEVAFIIFLFYANLLMGEFTASNRQGKTLLIALKNIVTTTNFSIAIVCALIGFVVVEYLRKNL